MATVNKDFKIKSGLIVEGTNATVGGYDILTKKTADQNYIIGLIGGAATPDNTPDTVVLRDESGNFAAGVITADIVGDVTGNADTATALETARTIELTGDVTGSVSFDGTANVQISTTLDSDFATDSEVATAKGEAISDAAADVNSKIGDNTVDGTSGNTVTARIATAKSEAITDAGSYTDGRETAITTAYQSYADTAEQDAKDYADALINDASNLSTEVWSAYKTSTEIGLAQAAAEQHADEAVAELVGSAPALLDTLQELAAALDNDPDAINSLQNIAAGKQDTLTPGNGIVIDDNLIYVPTSIGSGISVTPSTVEIDRAVVDTWYDASGSASDVQDNLDTHTNASSGVHGVTGSVVGTSDSQTLTNKVINGNDNTLSNIANASLVNDSITINGSATALGGSVTLDTDDVSEGTAQYFTDARAKTSAADLLTGATLSNITITGNGSALTITAENGVADSTTDDLVEGSTNKYFADQLALDAMSNATSVEVQKLDISWVRREEAAYASVATASTATVHSFGTNEGSVKYLVRVYNNNKSHVTEVLATTDSDNNVAVVEYGTIYTSENPLATVTVVWNASSSQYDLNVTTANNNSEVLVAATLLAYND